MRSRPVIAALALAALSGCARSEASLARTLPTNWRSVVTNADRTRLREWRTSWTRAVARVQASGNGARLAAEGALLDSDRALPGATPPPGTYRCRAFKLRAKAPHMPAYTVDRWSECRVSRRGSVDLLEKTTGVQRVTGRLLPDGSTRAVFLGTLVLGDETNALHYGQDATRDIAGFVQRVEPARWRVVLPAPAFQSLLDVVELVPS